MIKFVSVILLQETAPPDTKTPSTSTSAFLLQTRSQLSTTRPPAFLDGVDMNMTIRDLGGKRLFFRNDMRPRARYLYFLFVVAQLKLAWRHEYRNNPANVLKKQLGKGFWATKGRYLKRAFLLAIAEEIGHDTRDL